MAIQFLGISAVSVPRCRSHYWMQSLHSIVKSGDWDPDFLSCMGLIDWLIEYDLCALIRVNRVGVCIICMVASVRVRLVGTRKLCSRAWHFPCLFPVLRYISMVKFRITTESWRLAVSLVSMVSAGPAWSVASRTPVSGAPLVTVTTIVCSL